jgi:hypothetical protein
MPAAKSKRNSTVLVQVKVSRRAANELRKRAKRSLRTQASYLRALLYRDLGLTDNAGE